MLPRISRRRRPTRLVLILCSIIVFFCFYYVPSSRPAPFTRILDHVKAPASISFGAGDIYRQLLLGTPDVPMLRDVRQKAGTVVPAPLRSKDVSDSFQRYRRTDECYLNSLDLHEPFEPLCPDRKSVLKAMSDGGRGGQNMPYMPRGCDMRWYTTEEICEILSRFSYIWTVGDSLMRHVTSALHLLIREDLVEGGFTKWRPNNDVDCRCNGASDLGGCFGSEAWSSRDIWEQDPKSMQCPRDTTARIEYTVHNKFPLSEDNLKGFSLNMPQTEPEKPMAFIFGHGLWNDLNITMTRGWYEQVDEHIMTEMPWVWNRPDSVYPRLFMTPSAGGVNKPFWFQDSQGNYAVTRFEWAVQEIAEEYGFEVLGTVNLTVQSSSPDGTHAGRRADLIKAQMVLNWLDRLDV